MEIEVPKVEETEKVKDTRPRSSVEARTYSQSCISSYLGCPYSWYCYYVLKLRRMGPKKVPLNYGTCWHEAQKVLNQGEMAGIPVDDALVDIAERQFASLAGVEDQRRTAEHGMAWFREYVAQYKGDGLVTRDAEVAFSVDMPDSSIMIGIMDRIVEVNGKIYVFDYKTASSVGKGFFSNNHPAIQYISYCYACRELVGKCDGYYVCGASTAMNPKNDRFQRMSWAVSDKELDNFTVDWTEWIRQIEYACKNESFTRDSIDCGKYGGCDFKQVCQFGWNDSLLGLQFERGE